MRRPAVYLALAGLLLLALSGREAAAANGPEGVKWSLIELGSVPVPPLPSGQEPFIMFDPARKQATGFAGCNRFFGKYELAGQSLVFGPLGMTRRACPETESAVEAKFIDALARTSGWIMENGALRLVADGHVLARFAMSEEEHSDAGLER